VLGTTGVTPKLVNQGATKKNLKKKLAPVTGLSTVNVSRGNTMLGKRKGRELAGTGGQQVKCKGNKARAGWESSALSPGQTPLLKKNKTFEGGTPKPTRAWTR